MAWQVGSSGECWCGGGSWAAAAISSRASCPGAAISSRASDQLASAGELFGARVTAFGEQAVVPDAVEALWQHVHEEPADELARFESHGFVALGAFEAVVLVFERDAVRVSGDQAAVGDGDADGCSGKGRPAPALAR